ncbi:MAG: GH36-type glycosyl hydrolase domain-containing protein, partial [Anaerolineales bacterium]
FECRHGTGYTKICSQMSGIEAQTRYFVPLGENLEVWELTLKNLRVQEADLSVFASVEFCLWDALDDATNYQRNYSIGEVEIEDGVIYHKSEYRERRRHFAYMACSEALTGYDTQREAFLGAYRGWESPRAVAENRMTNSMAHGWQPVGAQQVSCILQPGEEKKIVFLLGYFENPQEEKFDPAMSQILNKRSVKPVIERFLHTGEVEKAFRQLKDYWDGLLQKFQVRTPDMHTDRMVNIWNAYQVVVTFNISRSASYFESGVGRGMGFRDSNQDLLGFMHLDLDRARTRILDLAATQMLDGGAYHQYQPLTKRGNDAIGSGFNDDPLWLVLSVAAYLKETGDWAILDEPVPYDNAPGTEEPLYDHLLKAVDYTLHRLGPNNLPLIGRADWNDCLNLNCFSDTPGQSFQTTSNIDGKVAESVFIAGLFMMAAKEMAEIATYAGQNEHADQYRAAASQMQEAVWTAGWDGAWFRRAYDHLGRPVGSQECEEGQIFIEPQGMCVMAGMGIESGRAQQALDAVAERLATEHGVVLLNPAYSRYYLHLGEISSYPPGYKENGGVFCHNNPWVMIAETRIGRGGRAYDYYLRINPSYREAISEVHRCEPYVYAQMIAGKDAPTFGEAKNSWLTGTAAWNYVAITQWILGIRPAYNGLQISPVTPESWDQFEAVRVFRGVKYNIQVQRVGPGNEVALKVNGEPVSGSLVPLPPEGTTDVDVMVRIGS